MRHGWYGLVMYTFEERGFFIVKNNQQPRLQVSGRPRDVAQPAAAAASAAAAVALDVGFTPPTSEARR